MLKHIISFSLRHASVVLVLALGILVLAFWRMRKMPVDVFPELNAPQVVILTEARGMPSESVEQFVTFPLEAACAGLPGVRRVRSQSALSLSLVFVEFDWGEDIYRARQVVREALDSAKASLPPEVHAEMAPIAGITGEFLLVGLTQDADPATPEVSPLELRGYGEFELRRKLLSVPGVAQVVALGGQLPEYQVLAKADQLAHYGLTLDDVTRAAAAAHSVAGAGYLPAVRGTEIPMRQEAQVASADDIKKTVVAYKNGVAVTLGDVAEVKLGAAPPRGNAGVDGQQAVILGLKKAPGTNTLDLTAAVEKALEEAKGTLPKGAALSAHVFRQADFIELSLRNVKSVLLEASLFVAVILILFLLNVRTTLITLTAIPLSMAVAILAMDSLGMGINVMTLGGLAIAIGELVDDAIIDVENIQRRMKQHADAIRAKPRHRLAVIFDACNEIRSSVVFATLIICLVFAPMFFLEGIEGRFFKPMGVAYVVSILASLVVAVAVVPALAKFLMKPGKEKAPKEGAPASHGEHDGFLARFLLRLYEPALRVVLRFRLTVIALSLSAVAGAGLLATTFGADFLPAFNEGTVMVAAATPPGTALSESVAIAAGLEKRLAQIPSVTKVARRTGRAERDEHAHGVEVNEFMLSVAPGADPRQVRRDIEAQLKDTPGLSVSTGAPIAHQISSVLSGTPAGIAIDLYGTDLAVLREAAKEVEGELKAMPGAADILANREAMLDALPIRYRRADLARFGLTPGEAAEQVETAFQGRSVAQVNDGARVYDLVVRMEDGARKNPADVAAFLLRSPSGALVPLSEVADLEPSRTPLGIARQNGLRKAVVSLNAADGYNLGDLVEAVRQKVEPIALKRNLTVHFGGQFEARQSASQTLYFAGAFTVAVVAFLLTIAFRSFKAALLVMVNLPLALIGGVVAVFLTEGAGAVANLRGLLHLGGYTAPVLSIASLVGFITLFGIAVRNGLLLVNHYGHLLRIEGASFEEAVVRGSKERLIPILMTALAALLGLIPLALRKGQPGSELLAPLAIVVLGGLATSTFLNLFVVPAGYHLLFRKHPPLADDAQESQTSAELGEPSSPPSL